MRLRVLGAAIALLFVPVRVSAQELDEKLGKRIARLDEKLLASLADLAKKHDADKNPEAAHFFASCAVGFGSKEGGVAAMKGGWETDLFMGKVRGGEITKDTREIKAALAAHALEYKRLIESLLGGATEGSLNGASKQALFDCGIRYEVARSAHGYILATQRFNRLRREMGLRAVLWDFEVSHKLILAAWYMAETGDASSTSKSNEKSLYYDPIVERAKAEVAKSPFHTVDEHPDFLRSYALARQDILNPNCRRLWLAQWQGGKKLESITLYAIPQQVLREDIPTPTQRFRNETVVKGWVDTEETIEVKGRKVPYVKYPYAGEPDAPWCFSNGQGAQEAYWNDAELPFLKRAGVPVMLRFFAEGKLSDVTARLDDGAGKEMSCRVYISGDKRVALPQHLPTVLVIPEKQLERGGTYSITLKCTFDGEAVEKSWRFSTRAK